MRYLSEQVTKAHVNLFGATLNVLCFPLLDSFCQHIISNGDNKVMLPVLSSNRATHPNYNTNTTWIFGTKNNKMY